MTCCNKSRIYSDRYDITKVVPEPTLISYAIPYPIQHMVYTTQGVLDDKTVLSNYSGQYREEIQCLAGQRPIKYSPYNMPCFGVCNNKLNDDFIMNRIIVRKNKPVPIPVIDK